MTIKLDLRTDLAKVTTDSIAPLGRCVYTAPCAVGAMMCSEQREQLRELGFNGAAVGTLVLNTLIEVPEDQLADFKLLQNAFDSGKPAQFALVLAELKEKYTL